MMNPELTMAEDSRMAGLGLRSRDRPEVDERLHRLLAELAGGRLAAKRQELMAALGIGSRPDGRGIER